MSAAVGAYLRLSALNNGADPVEMEQELAQLRSSKPRAASSRDKLMIHRTVDFIE